MITIMELLYFSYIKEDYYIEQISIADVLIWNQREYFFSYYFSLLFLLIIQKEFRHMFNWNICIRYKSWESIWKENIKKNIYISMYLSTLLMIVIVVVFGTQGIKVINFDYRNSVFSLSTYGGTMHVDIGIILRIVSCFWCISLIKLFILGLFYIILFWVTEKAVVSFVGTYIVNIIINKYNFLQLDMDYLSWYKNREHINISILVLVILVIIIGKKICRRKEVLDANRRHN